MDTIRVSKKKDDRTSEYLECVPPRVRMLRKKKKSDASAMSVCHLIESFNREYIWF